MFNQFAVNPTCRVCGTSPETRQHFLTECQPLHKPRDRFFKKIQSITEVDIGNMVPMCDVTQLILDPSLLFTSETIIDKIELHSRELISILHKLRTKILLEKDRQQGHASSVFNQFRGSSSKQQRLRIQNSKKKQQKHSTSISNRQDTTTNQPKPIFVIGNSNQLSHVKKTLTRPRKGLVCSPP